MTEEEAVNKALKEISGLTNKGFKEATRGFGFVKQGFESQHGVNKMLTDSISSLTKEVRWLYIWVGILLFLVFFKESISSIIILFGQALVLLITSFFLT